MGGGWPRGGRGKQRGKAGAPDREGAKKQKESSTSRETSVESSRDTERERGSDKSREDGFDYRNKTKTGEEEVCRDLLQPQLTGAKRGKKEVHRREREDLPEQEGIKKEEEAGGETLSQSRQTDRKSERRREEEGGGVS